MSKILILEDDRDIADLIAIHLNDNGPGATKVHDGKEGLRNSASPKHLTSSPPGKTTSRQLRMLLNSSPLKVLPGKFLKLRNFGSLLVT
jgi:hypothetical protein